MQLKTGDILHCTGKRLISRLIRRFTKSKISHTALVVECWGQLYIVDAQRRGVNLSPIKDWNHKYQYEIIVSRNKHYFSEKALSIKALSKVGMTPYDFKSLFIIYPIYLLTGKWISKKTKNDNKHYCSDYVAWVYDMKDFWKQSPENVYQYFSNNKNFDTFEFKIEE
jgi:hypothetical protein